jgi:hypothetical protein
LIEETIDLNAVSRFDAPTRLRRIRGLPKYIQAALYVLGAVMALLLVFQLFFRYQYMEVNGKTWRIDRLTQQTCQLDIEHARCQSAGSAQVTRVSTSTSTSTSTSISTSLKVPTPKHKR